MQRSVLTHIITILKELTGLSSVAIEGEPVMFNQFNSACGQTVAFMQSMGINPSDAHW